MKIKQFLKDKYPVFLIFIVIIGLLIWNPYKRLATQIKNNDQKEGSVLSEEFKFHRIIDGKGVNDEKEVMPELVAVMIENSSDAWPLSGLENASIVYEALSEGRIPRFLTIFPITDLPDEVGPVRSARPYYVQIAKSFDALYAHVGGSPDGLALIKQIGLEDFNEFYNGQYFWRDEIGRFAPHNVYTSKDLILNKYREGVQKEKKYSWVSFENLKSDESKFILPYDVIVNYTPSTYQAKYVYDPAIKKYQRYQAKEPLITREEAKVFVDNVVIEEHPHQVLDSVGRRSIELSGKGRVWVFRNGEMVEGSWTRETSTSPVKYLDLNSTEIKFMPGTTWVNLVEVDSFTPPTIIIQENSTK